MCFDGVKRLCHIRGKLRKKVWINQSDIVLIGLRDYQDAKADVILKYSADEARNLKSYGEFPESVKINETVDFVGGDLDDDIEFDDVDSEGSGSDEGDDIDDDLPGWLSLLFVPFELFMMDFFFVLPATIWCSCSCSVDVEELIPPEWNPESSWVSSRAGLGGGINMSSTSSLS